MDNVINFKEIKERKELKEQEKFDSLVDQKLDDEKLFATIGYHAALDILQVLEEFDYDLYNDPKVIRDIFLVIEAIRGIGNRLTGELYHMHSVSDALFGNIVNDEELLEDFLSDLDNE